MQTLDLRRKEYDRLTRRIAAADQCDLFAGAQARLDRRRPVGNARALECRQIGDVGPAIPRAGRDDDRPRTQAAIAGQFQCEPLARAIEPLDLDRHGDLRAELQRLDECASGQRLS